MPAASAEEIEKLKTILAPYSRILILTHNNPDPDALASAAGLRLLVNKIARKATTVAYAGFLSRAENKEMVTQLRLRVRRVERMDLRRFRAIMLVDTQPKAGNNPVSTVDRVIGVVDHHPLRRASRSVPFALVDSEAGATSSLVWELLRAADITPPSNIATALFFGIKTDTQDLGRNATARDLAAYKELFPLAVHKKLALVTHPRLPITYYQTVSSALKAAALRGDCLYVPIGDVTTPEYVSEIADYMVSLSGVRWVVATGSFQGNLYFSLRTLTARKDAGRILRKAIGRLGFAGGHQKMSGGIMVLNNIDQDRKSAAEEKVLAALFDLLGVNSAASTPLLPV